ncbi:MAG TPA: L,D-transpeptidase [Ramlibacter sp.]|nr:L,D-transpeptidase [Ramlibacter sp.]
MSWKSRAFGAMLVAAAVAGAPVMAAPEPKPDFGRYTASADARRLAEWIVQSADHGGAPFAIVDKKSARLLVFDGTGTLRGMSAALLGQAIGDDIAPNVGANTQAGFVPPQERTTPAGRFVSEPGRNDAGEHIVWVDYDSAFAIHRLRPGASHGPRAQRLASGKPEDSRVSYGCVIVSVAFYETVVTPLIGRKRAVVYVLPDKGSWRGFVNSL